MRALAIVCIRNEAVHIRRCITHLIESGLDVFVIDHESTDDSRKIASQYLGRGVVGIENLRWTGVFSLSDQLRAKNEIIFACDYDWVVHVDADEWLVCPKEEQTLYQGIVEAHQAGFTCINFHEIVFIPLPGEDFYSEDYASRMSTYYFYQPSYPRLNRAWNRQANLDNSSFGGHFLFGDQLKQYPVDFFLRHYIVLSEQHARTKYTERTFAEEDLSKGWHGNRLMKTVDGFSLPGPHLLKQMQDINRHAFDLGTPMRTHYWEW